MSHNLCVCFGSLGCCLIATRPSPRDATQLKNIVEDAKGHSKILTKIIWQLTTSVLEQRNYCGLHIIVTKKWITLDNQEIVVILNASSYVFAQYTLTSYGIETYGEVFYIYALLICLISFLLIRTPIKNLLGDCTWCISVSPLCLVDITTFELAATSIYELLNYVGRMISV